MNLFEKISVENLHHAYLLVGETKVAKENVLDFLRKNFGVKSGSPDLQNIICDTLTVDHARKIALDASRKSFDGGWKFFIIETNIITEEAQNALLKIFEEPNPGTHFFVIMPQNILLSTLRSRMQIVNLQNFATAAGEQWSHDQIGKLESILKKSIVDRLALVKEIVDGISDEEKTKQDAVALLNKIENELYQNGVEKSADDLALCQKTREALYDRGAPVKMILENLMISLG
jgi:DNA polymerase III delta prime subunit